MRQCDQKLGMDRPISRRDFINGVGVAAGASLLPACGKTGDYKANSPRPYYPPAATGMRGAHPGSFETAHALVQGQEWEVKHSGEHYDLVVVGAGISGLAAAHIYRRDVEPNASILVLDNHDDFGGHAKRNEFSIDGRTLLGFGGTMFIESPKAYPQVAKQVLRDIGIRAERYDDYSHDDLFRSMGLVRGTFYDSETFGEDVLTVNKDGFEASIETAPLSQTAKEQLRRLIVDEEDYLAGRTASERLAIVESLSWAEFLRQYAGMGDEVLSYLQKRPHGIWAIGADALPAWYAWVSGYPGFAAMDLGVEFDEGPPGGAHFRFPDGNASIARSLVRSLVPGSAPGTSMEDIVTARFDYAKLDIPENKTRIRLNSTVVDLRHRNADIAGDIEIAYVGSDGARSVSAGKVVWAGYHAMLPYICPDVADVQAESMRSSVRAPLVYINVLVRNWRSFAELGLHNVFCPGSFFQSARLSPPMSIGDYHYPKSPDEPMVLHLQHMPLSPGLPAVDQFRAGRRELLEMPFSTFERHVRDQLGRILGPGGFDPARDIAAITVNRWPHGYAYSTDPETGDVAWWPEYWQHASRPWIDARQKIGNITIAGTDAASNAMTEAAIEEAYRAVHEFLRT